MNLENFTINLLIALVLLQQYLGTYDISSQFQAKRHFVKVEMGLFLACLDYQQDNKWLISCISQLVWLKSKSIFWGQ